MTPCVRRFALTVHVIASVGWIGAVAAYLALDITALTTRDPQTLRAVYLAMEVITQYVIVPLAFTSLSSGIIMSLGTRWGLFRHYWVVISLLLTIVATVVLLAEQRTIGSFADVAADPATSNEGLRALGNTLVHSVGGMAVLLVILVLNVYKPRGLTQYGWWKQQEERNARNNEHQRRTVSPT